MIELLAPAGDLEKLKTAIEFGADAVFLGGDQFGLRVASKNFNNDTLVEGVEYAHSKGKKVYITVNIQAHNEHVDNIEDYLVFLYEANVDAIIVSDDGIYRIAKKIVPDLEIHISTQASITNYQTILFWYDLGVRRVVLARELSIEEIKHIRKNIPDDMELEVFVHGAMCISYSGRCLLSNYFVDRDANLGDCAQSCRWKYHIVEETRPGEYYPIVETEGGSFIMNSKDLCMIGHIDELMEIGINSFKIEGRVKTVYYVATVIRAYRLAMEAVKSGKYDTKYKTMLLEEIKKASYRDFTTGFFYKKPNEDDQLYEDTSYIRNYDFVGRVLDIDFETNIAKIQQRNRIFAQDEIEIFGPREEYFKWKIGEMFNDKMEKIDVAPHAKQIIYFEVPKGTQIGDFLRKKVNENVENNDKNEKELGCCC